MKGWSLRNPKISGLYAITPELENTWNLLDKTRQALEGGAKLIQYRNKSANRILLREQARLLLQLCREYEIPLIINDYLDLAMEIDADGLHVGQHDAAILEARDQLGCNKIIGASCYNNLDQAIRAEKEGADYVAFGAFFPSLTKPNTVSVTVNLIGEAKKKITVPIVGIGGIRLSNAAEIIQAGCAAVAVSDDLFNAPDIQDRARQFQQLFGNAA